MQYGVNISTYKRVEKKKKKTIEGSRNAVWDDYISFNWIFAK